MKTNFSHQVIHAVIILTVLATTNAFADKYKAGNTNWLNQAASWTNNAVPTSTDFGVWSSIVTAPNTTNTLGADMTWGGIKIINPGASVMLTAGNTLTLVGVTNVGIDMSSATRDLTINCALSLASNQTWSVNSGRTLTVNSAVSGVAALATSGRGTVILNGADTFTGTTTVSNGTLQVNGSLTASAVVDVKTNATLGGNGIIGGSVLVESGGTLSPGGGIGTLTVSNNLTLTGTAVMEINRTVPSNDQVVVYGNVVYNGGSLVVSNLSGALVAGDCFNLFVVAGSSAGTFANIVPARPGTNLFWIFDPASGTLCVTPGQTNSGCTITNVIGTNPNGYYLGDPGLTTPTSLGVLFPNAGGNLDFCMVYIYNCSDTNCCMFDSSMATGFADCNDANMVPAPIINPGEGFCFINTSGSAYNWVVSGTPGTPKLPPPNYCGCGEYSLLCEQSCSLPGTFQNITGFAPQEGAQEQIWNGSFFDIFTFTGGVWTPSNPRNLNIGEAAFFLVPCGTNTLTYTNTIAISNCCSLVADQLNHAGGNTLTNVFGHQLPDGTTVSFWNCCDLNPTNAQASSCWVTYIYDSTGPCGYGPGVVWYQSDDCTPANVSNVYLNPGQGALVCPSAPVTLKFAGTTNVPVLPATLPCGCGQWNLLSCQTNAIGTYQNVIGLAPVAGSQVIRWTCTNYETDYATYTNYTIGYTTYTFSGTSWSPGAPSLNIGEAAFFFVPCSTNCISMTGFTNKTVPCGSAWIFDAPTNIVDNCCTNYHVSFSTVTNSGPCPWVITGTWILSDTCSNSATYAQTVTVVNTNLPVIQCPSNILVMSCFATQVFYTVTASNVCCTNISVWCYPSSGTVFAPGTTNTVYCTAVDCCTNIATNSFTVTVVKPDSCQIFHSGMSGPDGDVPLSAGALDPHFVLVSQPSGAAGTNAVVAGSWASVWLTNTATSQWISPATDPHSASGTYHYQLQFLVCCTNNVQMSGLLAADDSAAVYLNNNWVANVAGYASWTPINLNRGFVVGLNTLDIYVTNIMLWTGMKAELTNCTSGLLVVCPTNKTVSCGTAWSFDWPTGSSCCDTSATVSVLTTVTNSGPCPWVISRTWGVSDGCSNYTTCTQTVTVVDTNPPAITCASNKTVPCGMAWTFDPPSAWDQCCGSNVTVWLASSNLISGPCPAVYQGVWCVMDCCSNVAACTQLVTVVHTQPPIVNLLCLTNVYFAGGSNNFTTPVASSPSAGLLARLANGGITSFKPFDDCTVNAFLAHTFTNLPVGCITAATLTLRVKPCGDISDNDTVALSCTGSGGTLLTSNNWSHFLGADNGATGLEPLDWTTANYPNGAVITLDLANLPGGGNLLSSLNQFGLLDFVSQDDSGVDYLQLTVVSCCYCATNKTVECNSNWSFDAPSAIDACSGAPVPITSFSTVTNSGPCPWMITRTWVFTDICGNTNTCSQTVTVVDTTAPVFTYCPTNKTVPCGTSWLFDRPSAWDACCGTNVALWLACSNLISGPCPAVWQGIWQAMDCCSNYATCTQLVTVVNTQAPILNLICMTNVFFAGGSNNFTAPVPSSPSAGLLARLTNGGITSFKPFDDCTVNAFLAHTFTNLPVGCITAATLTLRVKPCGDIPDNDMVSLSFTGSGGTLLTTNDYWSSYLGADNGPAGLEPNSWTTDNYPNGAVITLDLANLPGTGVNLLPMLNASGFLDFVMEDDSGADYLQLTLVSCCYCATNKTVLCGSSWNFDAPSAIDACSGAPVPITSFSTVTNSGPCPWIITRTWVFTDICNNTNTCSQTVTVVDTTPPVMSYLANKTVQCGEGYNILYAFTNGTDGGEPVAGLVSSGNLLYGTAMYGGSAGYGTVFSLHTDGTCFTTLYSFTNGTDGGYPHAGLVLSGNTLYGTAAYGGSAGYGTVFSLHTDGTGFTILYSFTDSNDGGYPYAGLVLSGNTLYGTAADGGSAGYGTVFSLTTDTKVFTTLHTFTATDENGYNSDGIAPYAGLILSGNTLYGTASAGGDAGYGTVFSLTTNTKIFTTLHTFTATDENGYNSDGIAPYAGLVLSGNTLYGTAAAGGSAGYGTVFSITTDSQVFTTLHTFTATDANGENSDGIRPYAGLVLSGNTLYGTTFEGGSTGHGTVFSVTTDSQVFTTLHNFFTHGSDGGFPCASLALSGNTLYGTTEYHGSPANAGAIFSLCFHWSFDRPSAWDACCGTNVTVWLASSNLISGPCPAIYQGVWCALDCCSNLSTCTQTVTVVDTIPPVFTYTPTNKIQCGTNWSFDKPSAWSACCGTNVTIWLASSNVVLSNPLCQMVWQGIWKAMDCCSNFNTCTQLVTVVGTQPPTVIQRPGNITVTSCTAVAVNFPTNQLVVTDNCDGNVTVSFNSPSGNLFIPGTSMPVFWAATDSCGNFTNGNFWVTVNRPSPCQVFNTGMTGPDGNVPLAGGQADPHFILVSSPPGEGTTAVVATYLPWPWIPNTTNSQWIASGVNTVDSANGVYHYQLRFLLCCTNAQLVGRMAVDDTGGISLNDHFAGSVVNGFGAWTPISLTGGFVSGTNVLDIYVTNMEAWNGLRAELTVCQTPLTLTGASNKTIECGSPVSFDPPTVISPCCTNQIIPWLASSNCLSSGPCTSVWQGVWAVWDTCNNDIVTCTQLVTVVDTNLPVIYCPSNLVVTSCTNVRVFYTNVTASSSCLCASPTVVCTPSSGSFFAPDTTNTVICMATNCCGYVASNRFTVTVLLSRNSIPGLFNTGGTLGGTDPHYVLVVNPYSTNTQPSVVNNNTILSLWLTNTAVSQWIGPETDGEGWSLSDYDYRLTFNLCCTNNASITGRWAADDGGVILLNNSPIADPNGILPATGRDSLTNWHTFTITSGFVQEQNTLDFWVTNYMSYTGLRVELSGFTACCSNAIQISCSDIVTNSFTSIVLTNYPAKVTDNCCSNLNVWYVPAPPESFAPGMTNYVTCWASDCAGNSNYCTFSVIVVPVATNPTNLNWSANGSQLTLSWPADHLGWHLEVQTNSLATGLNTNWFNVPDSDGTNQMVMPINHSGGAVFYRLRYP